MTVHLYRVGYHCPACSDDHLTDHVKQSLDKGLDGRPLIDLYRGDESRPELVAILGEIHHCGNRAVTPALEQFFLVTAR
ncbi:MAG TPA: hypothetical protein DC054_09360 [Blastocatellia bacterium]|nr:hypothetical protein [Blastocatellia bacterium]